MCQVSNLVFGCMGNLHIHLPQIHIGLKEIMKVQALWPRYRPDALFHPSDILLTTVCARVVHTIILGSSICKHCHYFAGRQERLNSLGAQVDGEHDPPQQTVCMNGFIHTVYSLPASLTSRLKELPWPPPYCLLEQVSRLAFLAVLLTPPEVCTSAFQSCCQVIRHQTQWQGGSNPVWRSFELKGEGQDFKSFTLYFSELTLAMPEQTATGC